MEAQARGEIIIKISMVNHMQSPEQRNSMMQHVLEIDGQIKGKNADGDSIPNWRPRSLIPPSCAQMQAVPFPLAKPEKADAPIADLVR